MKLNSTLEKKLLRYSAMASGVVAMGASADAQIVYYDENPDVVITGHQQGVVFDFDGDTADDMAVATFDGSATGSFSGYNYTLYYKAVAVFNYSGAAVVKDSNSSAAALSAGAPINSLGAFSSATGGVNAALIQTTHITPSFSGQSTFGPYSDGQWIGATDKYLGFRFTSAGNVHYGWIRMTVDATVTTVTIKDWAYNGTPDAAINAGQTVGVNDEAKELAKINFFNNRLDLNVVNGTAGNVTIVNMEGQVVFNKGINNSFESMDLSNLAAGLYVVNAEFAEGSVQHKIVVR